MELNDAAREFVAERTERRRPNCPQCQGKGDVVLPAAVGPGYMLRQTCPSCYEHRQRVEFFARNFFNPENVMPRYWGSFLSKLQPSKVSLLPLGRQAEIIDKLRKEPDKGYAFFGPARTGKTTFAVALFAENMWRELNNVGLSNSVFPVRRTSTKKMLDQHTDYAMHKNDPDWSDLDRRLNAPDVSAEKIIEASKAGRKYRLFLEEIDKVKETESRRANLFELLDTLYGCEGQLVINSNLKPAEFAAQFGADFMHRIGMMCEVINLFEEEKSK